MTNPQPAIDEATVETLVARIQAQIDKARATRDQGAVTTATMSNIPVATVGRGV